MSLQPDPSILGNTSGPFLDALTIKTNDVKSLCFIFHHMETTSNPDLRVGVRNRGSSVQFSPNASIRMPQNKPKIPQRRASKKLFRSPFLRRRTRSVESNFNEVNQRNLPIGHLRRRSIVKSSVGDELSYLEAADSLEGPPCQRMLTRINNRVINRLAEISNYEMIHSDLLSTILHTATASDSNSINREQNSKISVEPDSYTHWIHQLPNPYRNFISRIILDGWNLYDPISEFNRMGIPDAAWRISNINADYEVCSTYPAILVIPASLDDHRIVLAAQFRSRNRLPAFSWRHPINRCCLCRASQPLVGLSQNRSLDDEMLLEAINLSSKVVGQNDDGTPQYDSNIFKGNSQVSAAPLIIVDARPKINAQANQAAGKGYEIGKGYENCHVLFMGIANIHVMRKSIDMLEDFCNNSMLDDTNWMKNVESTGWLHHVSRVLTASVRIVHCIAFEEYSVLVHCSDGWDRTAQLTSLPMLMMDPFYRTFRGFMILIEKEWFSFGHKFADRLGWTEGGWNDAERSPVFHQFLDCVHQCLLQNPNIFEFNQEMLVFLGKHVLSGWFGNAFANCEFDRTGLWESTISIWTYLDVNKQSYINPHYQPLCTPYWVPNTSVRCLQVWELWFLKWSHSVWDLFWRKKNEDFSDRPDDPSVWMEDNMTQCCCDCQKPFNFIRRRHHCRACGRIFCENCVKQTRIIPNISEKIPVRCCEDCSNQMSLLDDGKDKKSKSSDKENPNFMKNSTLASFFGIKTSSSHEEIVLDNENFSDTSPNDYRNESTSTSHLNSPMMYSQLPEGTIRDEPSRSSERDTDTLFGQYINMTESLTKYPNSEQIASVKIDSSAGLADHPHHVARDPKPIDHYLINHQPFINLEYSDSDSDVDNNNDHELGSELPLEEKEKERVAFSSTDPHHLHHQQHQKQQQDIISSSSTNNSLNEKNHKTEKLHHSQKKEETKSHSHQRNKTASRSSTSPSTSPSPKSRSRSKSRSKSPQNSRKSRSPSSSPPPRSR